MEIHPLDIISGCDVRVWFLLCKRDKQDHLLKSIYQRVIITRLLSLDATYLLAIYVVLRLFTRVFHVIARKNNSHCAQVKSAVLEI